MNFQRRGRQKASDSMLLILKQSGGEIEKIYGVSKQACIDMLLENEKYDAIFKKAKNLSAEENSDDISSYYVKALNSWAEENYISVIYANYMMKIGRETFYGETIMGLLNAIYNFKGNDRVVSEVKCYLQNWIFDNALNEDGTWNFEFLQEDLQSKLIIDFFANFLSKDGYNDLYFSLKNDEL